MAEAARLAVVIEGDTRDLEADLKRAHGILAGFGSTATSALGGAAKAGSGLLESVSKLGIGVFGITQLGGAIGGLATGMVAGNAQMETYETQLTTLMGSADKAKTRLAELAKFGAETPFELPEIVRAEKVLLGFGLTGQKALDLTGKSADQLRTVIGDVAAGTGASFEEIALNFGKFSAGATGESISRLQELGVVTREQLQGMGVQFSKAGELMSPLPQAMAAAVAIAQQKFGGGMNALSKTFAGQMSTLADNFNQAKNVVTQPIFEVLKTAVGALNDVLSSGGFQATLKGVAAALAGMVSGGIALAIDGFGRLMTVLGPLSERITTFFGGLASGATLAAVVNKAFGDLIPAGLNPILDAVDAAFVTVKTTAGELIAILSGEGLAGVWRRVQEAMSDFAPTGERIAAVIDAVAAAVAALVPEPLKTFVANLLSTGQAASAGFNPLKALADVVNTVSAAIAAAVDWLRQNEVVLYAVGGAAAAVAAALAIQLAAQLAMTVATGAATAAQWLLNAALSANPIGIVVLALGALVGALIYAYQTNEDFRKVVDEVWAAVSTAITTVIDRLGTYLDRLGDDLATAGRVMTTLMKTAQTVFAAIATAVSDAWTAVATATTDTWTAIVGFLGPLWATLSATVSTVFGAIQSTVQTVWGVISAAITDAVTTASRNVATYLEAIRGAFAAVQTAIGGIVDAIKSKVEGIFASIVSTASSAKDTVKGILDTVQGWYDKIVGLVAAARSILAHLPGVPSGGGGGGGGTTPAPPETPAMPGEPPGVLRPAALGFGAAVVTVNVILPTGAYLGSVADFARLLTPELARVVAVRV